MEQLVKAIFEAAAWIMYARSKHLKVEFRTWARAIDGDYGTAEINPYWAGFPDIQETYSRYAMEEKIGK